VKGSVTHQKDTGEIDVYVRPRHTLYVRWVRAGLTRRLHPNMKNQPARCGNPGVEAVFRDHHDLL
jgi:hypothetical protein